MYCFFLALVLTLPLSALGLRSGRNTMPWPAMMSSIWSAMVKRGVLVVKEAHSSHGHGDAVFVAGLYDIVVPYGTARLGNVLHAALVGSFYVVSKGEERIASQGYASVLGYPVFLLLHGERLGSFSEELLPCALSQHVVMFLADVYVDGVVSIGTADAFLEGQVHHLGTLSKPPRVCLLPSQSRAVDTALLACANADGLPVFYVADRVALGILQGDEGDN